MKALKLLMLLSVLSVLYSCTDQEFYEKEYLEKMRLSTLERDEIVYRMEVAQEDSRKSLHSEENAFREELASQREHFEKEIEMKEREIRTRDDEIREKRREISQEDAESALRVEMTEMRIKDLAERAQKMVADAKNRSERSEMTWKWVRDIHSTFFSLRYL